MKKIFGYAAIVMALVACNSSSETTETIDTVATETVEIALEQTISTGVWKGLAPYADSDEKGNTDHEIILTIKEGNVCDLIGIKEDLKDSPYTFADNKLMVGEFQFELADGKLYLLDEEGKRLEMDDCYILELTPTEETDQETMETPVA